MIVRFFWRDCDYRQRKWGKDPIDSFWVECTLQEAEIAIFPRLKPEDVAESRKIAADAGGSLVLMGKPHHRYCFLVARDLTYIVPLVVHHPVHQLWNRYSPFELMPEVEIASLEELREFQLPVRQSSSQS